MISAPSPAPSRSTLTPAALFLLACAWVVVCLAGGRLVGTLSSGMWFDVNRVTTTALMLLGGFYLMARLGVHDLRPLSSIGFVKRTGAATEFGIGAALGWGIVLALLVPALLSANFHLSLHLNAEALQHAVLGTLFLAGWALGLQLIVAGLPVRLLVRSVGPAWTVVAVLFVSSCLSSLNEAPGRSLLVTLLAVSLFLTGFLRTRAIWLPLGLQIGWTLALQVLFGAVSPYAGINTGLVQTEISGPMWLTGGSFGPETSSSATIVLIVALVVLFRLTRTYAWHYTYEPVTAAGYPMDVAPPAAHRQEEQRAANAAPLVQIAGVVQAPPEEPRHP